MWKQAQLEQWQKDNPTASREVNHANTNGQVVEEEEEEEEYSGSGSEFYTDDSEEEEDDDDEYAPLEIAAWGNQATTAAENSAPVQLTWDSLIDPNVKVPTNGLGSGNLHRRGGNFIPVSEEMILQQRKGKPIPGSGKKKKKRKPKAKSGAPKPPKTSSKPIRRAPYVPSMPESSTIAKIANRDRAPITTGAWANAQLSSEAFWEASSNTGTSASKYAPQQSNNPPTSTAPVRPPGLPVPSSQQAGSQWGQQSQPMPSQWGQQQPQKPPVQVNPPQQQQQANGQWGQQQPQKAPTQQQQMPTQWGQQQPQQVPTQATQPQPQQQQQQQMPNQWGQQQSQQVPAQANKPQDSQIPTQWGQQTQPQVSSQASSQWGQQTSSQLNPTAAPWGQQPQQPQSQLSPSATPWVQHTQQPTSSSLLNPSAAPWGQQQPPEWNKPFQPPINIQVQPAPSRDVFDFSPHGSAASKYAPFSVKKAAEAAAQQLELQKKQQEYKEQQQQQQSPSSSQQGAAPKALVADFNIQITYGVTARLMVWENDDPLTVVEQFAKRCKLNIEGEGKRSFIEKVKKLLEEHELKKQQQ